MLHPAKSRPQHQSAKANGLSSNTPVPTDASARAQRPQGGNLCMVGMYRRTDRLVCVQPHQPCGCGWSVGTAFTLRLCCSSRTHFHRPSKQPSAHANASAPHCAQPRALQDICRAVQHAAAARRPNCVTRLAEQCAVSNLQRRAWITSVWNCSAKVLSWP